MGAIVWVELQESFPNLALGDVYVTDQYDEAYNCVAWSLGLTDEWVEPDSLAYMRSIYEDYGFYEVPARSIGADVDLMGKSVHYITHATTVYRGPLLAGMPAGLWESKLSNDRRITHSRYGLEDGGALYGSVVASFKKK
jgi:hypothetical protein